MMHDPRVLIVAIVGFVVVVLAFVGSCTIMGSHCEDAGGTWDAGLETCTHPR